MRILAFDGSLRNTGWCLYEDRPLEVGLITTHPKSSESESLAIIFLAVCELLDTYRPDLVAVEDQFMGSNARTYQILCAVRGAILAACGLKGVKAQVLSPNTVKVAVVGSRKGITKADVQKAVEAYTPPEIQARIAGFRKRDDIWDAIAIAITASRGVRAA